jgi:phospholipid transport system substrate-binding protein
MKRFLLAAALAAFALPGMPQATEAPDQLVKSVMLEVQKTIQQDKDLQGGDRRKTIDLVEKQALPHFNHVGMTALAVGVNWRKATPEQKERLAAEFRTLLVRTYASSLASFGDLQFDFRPLRMKPADTDVTVQVRVLQPGTQPVIVEYDMEKTSRGWKAYDVRVAGISLVVNYRTEFANIVRDSGIDGLIKTLEAKNRSLDQPKAGAAK